MMSGRLLLARGAVPDGIVCAPRAAPLSIAVVGTYPPRICGIATFTKDLVQAVGQNSHGARVRVAAMTRQPDATTYPPEVNIQIRQDAIADYAAAAAALNRTADVVCLQHEFGIFGGPDGAYVLELLHRLTTPIITTLHTILHQPTAGQRRVLRQIAEASTTVIVMSETARDFLTDLYGISPASVTVIPHGVPPQPFGDTAAAKSTLGLSARKVVLTFGLLSANKGIEMHAP